MEGPIGFSFFSIFIISKDGVMSNSCFIFLKTIWQSSMTIKGAISPFCYKPFFFNGRHITNPFFTNACFIFPFLCSLSKYSTKIRYGKWVKREFGLGSFWSPCMSNERKQLQFLEWRSISCLLTSPYDPVLRGSYGCKWEYTLALTCEVYIYMRSHD